MKHYLKLMRIHHYIKNFLVFAALACSGQLFNLEKLKPGDADSVVIAGMGGPLIIRILSAYPDVTDSLKELGEMRYSDPDRFYRIIRKEELFLNTCLQAFGFHNYLVSLNPDKLFGQL